MLQKLKQKEKQEQEVSKHIAKLFNKSNNLIVFFKKKEARRQQAEQVFQSWQQKQKELLKVKAEQERKVREKEKELEAAKQAKLTDAQKVSNFSDNYRTCLIFQ